jgi:type III pantothenate kinase
MAIKERIGDWIRTHWEKDLVEVRSCKEAGGVVNAYADPDKLGVDRWLCLIAVHHQTRAPACVVDCGTAVTLDGLDSNGQHLGGLILPGLGMMRDALLRNTQIQAMSPVGPLDLLARDTATAVAAGGLFACAGLVELVVRRIARQCGRVPEIVLTGGDGAKLQVALEIQARYEPDLVLQGLAQLVGDMES